MSGISCHPVRCGLAFRSAFDQPFDQPIDQLKPNGSDELAR
ncbi:hypothetical protein BZL29_6936 [Mycobacterium kansasii]|nr:hypothetical protein BZL29_6936 [Mycobacterium kansasii]